MSLEPIFSLGQLLLFSFLFMTIAAGIVQYRDRDRSE